MKRNLVIIFSKDSDPYKHSSFCSLLNQHLPDGLKVNPTTSGPELRATIEAVAEEGNLPNDKTMEEVLTDHEAIQHAEGTYI